jgi:hypothetical protein
MKTTIKNFAKVLLVAITIFSISMISSCSKDGEAGAPGKDGTNGQTGTANVIYSNWINQNWNSLNDDFIKSMNINEPKITTQVLNTGLVIGFFRFSDQTTTYTLPYVNQGSGVNIKREYIYSSGLISFYAFRFNNSIPMQELNLNGTATSIPQFRYILIPGGVSTTGRKAQPDYKNMSYEEICKKFNIPE